MSVTLRPHQTENVEKLLAALRNFGGALDGSSTGTGKTLTFLGLCKALNARPAIVTRKPIIPSWEDACKLIGLDPIFVTNYEAVRSENFKLATHVRKLDKHGNSKIASFEWHIPESRVLFCFDEAQALRDYASGNSKMAIAAYRKYKTVLTSATPFQTPLEAETIGQILGLFSTRGFYPWLFQHGCKKDYFGRMAFIGDIPDRKDRPQGANAARGQEHMLALHAEIFPAHGCRTKHTEIPGFPETLITAESIDTGAADEISQQYLLEIEERRKQDHVNACEDVDPEFHDLVEVLPIVRDMRFRQEVELLKCKAFAEMAQMSREKGRPVVIFVNFDSSVDLLSKYLKCDAIIRGDGSGKINKGHPNLNRAEVVRMFQRNNLPFVIVNSMAGGAGLSLHDPDTQVERDTLISPPYSAVVLKQILGRMHRLGGGGSTQKILFAHGTIEERVMNRVKIRLDNLDALVDGDLDVTG